MPAPVLGPIGDLGAHALIYAGAGLEVFPLNADKTPRTTHGMKDATTDAGAVEEWWELMPDSLIGCRIPRDVVILDVDPKHSGMTTWKALKDKHGRLPVTRTHQSGRNDGGGHLWFQRPAGRLSVRRLNRWAKDNGTGEGAGKHSWVSGIDLLHRDHRYTILPPSPHPATGAPYRWVEHRDLDCAPAPMPSWLAELVTEDPAPLVPVPRLSSSEVDSIADWFSATASWGDLLIAEGWSLVRGDGDSDGSLWRHPNATAPHSASVKHGCLFVYTPNTDFPETVEGEPHGVTRFRALTTLSFAGDASGAARAARTLRDGPRAPSDDFSWVGLTQGVGTTGELETPTVAPVAGTRGPWKIDWPEFWAEEMASEEWMVKPVIPAGRQVAIWATHKTGKSLITLEMVAAIATGQSCLGNPVGEPVDVMYLDFEMTKEDLKERLEDLGYGPEVDMAHLHYYLLPTLPPFDTAEGAARLLELVDENDARLLVIDTMSRVVAGEENDADTYRAFYRLTGLALKARGVAVVRLDHGGKNADLGQRGSSAKGDDVDLVWRLSTTDNGLQLDRDASRMAWVPEKVTLIRHDDDAGLRHRVTLEPDWPAGTNALVDVLDRLGVPVTASRAVARLALTEAGEGAKNDLLSKALKCRRQRILKPEDLI